jgi:hypothetical protein
MPFVTRFVACLTALVLAAAFGAAAPTAADTITITSGALQFGAVSGRLSIAGDRGFTMQASMDITGGIYDPWAVCSDPVCGPGFAIPLFAYWSGNDLPGTATIDGKTYPRLGSLSESQTASVKFFGQATAPALEAGLSASVTAPFTFEGFFLQPIGPTLDSETVRHDVVGGGLATLWLEKSSEGSTWRVVGSRYQFEPLATPEPATFVLVGSGLVIAFARRRFRGWRR